jgi:hypothetical protein
MADLFRNTCGYDLWSCALAVFLSSMWAAALEIWPHAPFRVEAIVIILLPIAILAPVYLIRPRLIALRQAHEFTRS